MNSCRRLAMAGLLLLLAGCETLPENIISKPDVQLRDIRVVGLGFNNQTFLLSFDIHNPNPFPLPVKHVNYSVRLDGQRFASGSTGSNLSVPAGGGTGFDMSVELDLLTTAPQLLSIMRDGVRSEVPYELEGELGIDLPFTPPVRYRTSGNIRLDSGTY